MYNCLPGLIIGFHGCEREVAEGILSGKERLNPSCNEYDWLGHGIYFWEYDPVRALDYAIILKNNPHLAKREVKEPFALGAVISLGKCLNLVDSESLKMVKAGYEMLKTASKASGNPLPANKKPLGDENDFLIRTLDCAVIETIHTFNKEKSIPSYDSVRGVFWEGQDLYPNAGFKEKNHIQICIRNPNCIKGYFRPLKAIEDQGVA